MIRRFRLIIVLLTLSLLAGCSLGNSPPTRFPTSSTRASDQAFSEDEIATLESLEKLDDYPLYSMRYVGDYPQPILSNAETQVIGADYPVDRSVRLDGWGCSLFAALGNPERRLYGRNFDWRFSPALLLFTDPSDGYASVSIVDIEYLGFKDDAEEYFRRAKDLLELPLNELQSLLEAPALPFDGMNEKGIGVAMAAVPPGEMRPDPDKQTIDQLGVMREILDHASTLDEAVDILSSYNIDMGSVPLHYLVASASGEAALVEFYEGKMKVFRNENPWHLATNFLVAATGGETAEEYFRQGQCYRYDRISQRMQETGGKLSLQEAFVLLEDVSQMDPQGQSSTQWSVVYDLTAGTVNIVMGREYRGAIQSGLKVK